MSGKATKKSRWQSEKLDSNWSLKKSCFPQNYINIIKLTQKQLQLKWYSLFSTSTSLSLTTMYAMLSGYMDTLEELIPLSYNTNNSSKKKLAVQWFSCSQDRRKSLYVWRKNNDLSPLDTIHTRYATWENSAEKCLLKNVCNTLLWEFTDNRFLTVDNGNSKSSV